VSSCLLPPPGSRKRRLVVLGAAAGVASGVGVGIHRRNANAATTDLRGREGVGRRGTGEWSMGGGGGGGGGGKSTGMHVKREDTETHLSVFTRAMAGAFAGGVSRVTVAPLDVIKIRMQVQVEPVGGRGGGKAGAAGGSLGKYRGVIQCAATIVKEEGARGLWSGTIPALFLWIPYTAIQFAALGEFRRQAEHAGVDPKSPPLAFAAGAFAGVAATVCTYPFDVIRTVLAAQGNPRVYHSLADAARGVIRDRGLGGLYAGLGVTLVEIIPASAIQFGSYAVLRAAAMKAEGKGGGGDGDGDALSATGNAACGFGAGCIARLIIHPLDVVKKRFQVAGLARSLRYGERVAPAAYVNFSSAFRSIAAREGVRGFYKGLVPGLLKSAPASAITFAVYEAVTRVAVEAHMAQQQQST